MKILKRLLCWLAITSLSFNTMAQQRPDFLTNHNKRWVDSVFASLSLDEKIGQLLMPRGNFSGKGYEPEKLKQWVRDYKIGGIVFFAGQPTTQARITNELQALSRVPMLIGQDFEWGLAMRLDSTTRFPFQMSLGAMPGHEALVERMGQQIGEQCRRLGVHVNYAPVVDVNSNPMNPVINFRSFGEDKYNVTAKALAYMKGLQSQRILATAKHFPGHGDTGVDSHYDLPLIPHNRQRLMDVELYPYKNLIQHGLTGVMTAHLSVPALDNTPNLASTFSKKIVTDLLRRELGFEGLAFTDAMDMQGAVKHFPNGQALVKAILAGNDILETFLDVPTAVKAIKSAIEKKELPMSILDQRVRKILMAKSWVGLDNYRPIVLDNLIADLTPRTSDVLNRQLAEASVVLVKNDNNALPISDLTQPVAVVAIGAAEGNAFEQMANRFMQVRHFTLPSEPTDSAYKRVMGNLPAFSRVVVALHTSSNSPYRQYGISEPARVAVNALLGAHANTQLVLFGNPLSMPRIMEIEKARSIVLAHQPTSYYQEAAAQAIFGAIPFQGKLPVSVTPFYPAGHGISTPAIGRLAYGVPEQVGLNGEVLATRIDSVINAGLAAKAYPGGVVSVAKDGRVIYEKAYGYPTYEAAQQALKTTQQKQFELGNKDVMDDTKGAAQPKSTALAASATGGVQLTDLYDLASVTKISTSALALMQLVSEGKFDLDKTFGHYYPPARGTNKENLTFRNMLTHRSGLKAWIPFWQDAIDSVATLKKAVALKLVDETRLVRTENRRNFWQRLFNRPITYTTDYEASARNKAFWPKALTKESMQWRSGIFAPAYSADFPVQITDSLWLHRDYEKTIYQQIMASPVKPEQGYVYSDLHYYFYPKFVPMLTGIEWEEYLKKTYRAIGANTLTYNPLRHYPKSWIIPTEYDPLFRKTLIQGRVHDEGAGMLNGVSGHAGLFGSANDLMKLMQLYLQRGTYGGQQFIKPEVVDDFTRYQFAAERNRRGIAFDKLDLDPTISNGPRLASAESYGHSGFTGTFTWVDPATQSVYVFLSNRVYPTRDNGLIGTMNIRTEIGNALYKTIQESKK